MLNFKLGKLVADLSELLALSPTLYVIKNVASFSRSKLASKAAFKQYWLPKCIYFIGSVVEIYIE